MPTCPTNAAQRGTQSSEIDLLFNTVVLSNINDALSVYAASESDLTTAQCFLDRCFKRKYSSKPVSIYITAIYCCLYVCLILSVCLSLYLIVCFVLSICLSFCCLLVLLSVCNNLNIDAILYINDILRIYF